jgi:saccharopine dehydrogenase-like NADP-dependent oxidoreductase
MKKVLILGAGRVAHPMVKYLLANQLSVTLADMDVVRARLLLDGHANGIAVGFDVSNSESLDALVQQHHLVVSLLPYQFHEQVAEACIRFKRNMVTTSYVKPEMQQMNDRAVAAGIIILNELGLDPGIDHMSAMQIIDHVHAQGGLIESFHSICGALPAPEAAENPFGYKFSWSPKGVIMASNNNARYLDKGKLIELHTKDLFKYPIQVPFDGVGELEVYPNRDSISYVDVYGIPEVKTMYRGTFRYKGWCEAMDALKALGLTSPEQMDFTGMSYEQMLAKQLGLTKWNDIKAEVAGFLGLELNAIAIQAMEWLGLFQPIAMGRSQDSCFDILSDLMLEKMELQAHERDMVVMQHLFKAAYPDGRSEVIRSRLLEFGILGSDTAIARTVSLPAAIGVKLILEEKINLKGIYRPVLPEIYTPVLEELKKLGIKMTEEYGLTESESIGNHKSK